MVGTLSTAAHGRIDFRGSRVTKNRRRVEKKPAPKTRRRLGSERGKARIADDFDAPLPPEIMAGFLGDSEEQKKT
jgi:hypothetical protein